MKFDKNNVIEAKFLDSKGFIDDDVLNSSKGLLNLMKGANKRVSKFFGYGNKDRVESDDSSIGVHVISKPRGAEANNSDDEESEKENSHVEIPETQESPVPPSPSVRRSIRDTNTNDKSVESRIRNRTMKSLGVKQLTPIDLGNSSPKQPANTETDKPEKSAASPKDPPRPRKTPQQNENEQGDSDEEPIVDRFKKPAQVLKPVSAKKPHNNSLRRSLFTKETNEGTVQGQGIVCSTPRSGNNRFDDLKNMGVSMIISPIKANSSTESGSFNRPAAKIASVSGIVPQVITSPEENSPKRSNHQSAPMSIEKSERVRIRSIAEIEKDLEKVYDNLPAKEMTPEKAKQRAKRLEPPCMDFEPKIIIKKSNAVPVSINKSKRHTIFETDDEDMEIEEEQGPVSKTPAKSKQNQTKNKTIRKSVCVQETPIHRNRAMSIDQTINKTNQEVRKKLAVIDDSDSNMTDDESGQKESEVPETAKRIRSDGIQDLQNDSDSPQLPAEIIHSMKRAARLSQHSPSPKSYALCKKSLRSRRHEDPITTKYLDISEKASNVFKKPKDRKRKNSEAAEGQTSKRRLYNRKDEEEDDNDDFVPPQVTINHRTTRSQSLQRESFRTVESPKKGSRQTTNPINPTKTRQFEKIMPARRFSRDTRQSRFSVEHEDIQENTVSSSRRSQKSSNDLSATEGVSVEQNVQNHVSDVGESGESRGESGESRESQGESREETEKDQESSKDEEVIVEKNRRESKKRPKVTVGFKKGIVGGPRKFTKRSEESESEAEDQDEYEKRQNLKKKHRNQQAQHVTEEYSEEETEKDQEVSEEDQKSSGEEQENYRRIKENRKKERSRKLTEVSEEIKESENEEASDGDYENDQHYSENPEETEIDQNYQESLAEEQESNRRHVNKKNKNENRKNGRSQKVSVRSNQEESENEQESEEQTQQTENSKEETDQEQNQEESEDESAEHESLQRSRPFIPNNSDDNESEIEDQVDSEPEPEIDRRNQRVSKKNKENLASQKDRLSRKRAHDSNDNPDPKNAKLKKFTSELRFLNKYTELELPKTPDPSEQRKSSRPRMYRKPTSSRYGGNVGLVYGVFDIKEEKKKRKNKAKIEQALKCPTFVATTKCTKFNPDLLALTGRWRTDDLLEMLKKDKENGYIPEKKRNQKNPKAETNDKKRKLPAINEDDEDMQPEQSNQDNTVEQETSESAAIEGKQNIISIIKSHLINHEMSILVPDTENMVSNENFSYVNAQNLEFGQCWDGLNIYSNPKQREDGYLGFQPLAEKPRASMKRGNMLLWVMEGSLKFTINNEVIECQAGEKITIKKGKYSIVNNSETDIAIVYYVRNVALSDDESYSGI